MDPGRFFWETRLEMNNNKSILLCNDLPLVVQEQIDGMISLCDNPLHIGLKYLGYYLNPNDYKVADWLWLLKKIEPRVFCRCYRWLSLDGRSVLLKVLFFVGFLWCMFPREFWKGS